MKYLPVCNHFSQTFCDEVNTLVLFIPLIYKYLGFLFVYGTFHTSRASD